MHLEILATRYRCVRQRVSRLGNRTYHCVVFIVVYLNSNICQTHDWRLAALIYSCVLRSNRWQYNILGLFCSGCLCVLEIEVQQHTALPRHADNVSLCTSNRFWAEQVVGGLRRYHIVVYLKSTSGWQIAMWDGDNAFGYQRQHVLGVRQCSWVSETKCFGCEAN